MKAVKWVSDTTKTEILFPAQIRDLLIIFGEILEE
jgi:hypothetical protein